MTHRRSKRWIRRMFEAELDGARIAQVMAHAATCADCRAYYARYRALEDLLYSAETPIADRAIDRVGAAVLARVSAQKRPLLDARGVWALVLSLLLLVPIATWLLTAAQPKDELRSRGPAVTAGASVGFRVLRLQGANVENVSELHAGDVVTFTYSNQNHAWRYIQVIGLAEHGAPFVVGDGSRAIIADVTDEPLPLIQHIDESLGATLELFAIFTETPLDFSETRLDGVLQWGDTAIAVAAETFTIQGAP